MFEALTHFLSCVHAISHANLTFSILSKHYSMTVNERVRPEIKIVEILFGPLMYTCRLSKTKLLFLFFSLAQGQEPMCSYKLTDTLKIPFSLYAIFFCFPCLLPYKTYLQLSPIIEMHHKQTQASYIPLSCCFWSDKKESMHSHSTAHDSLLFLTLVINQIHYIKMHANHRLLTHKHFFPFFVTVMRKRGRSKAFVLV